MVYFDKPSIDFLLHSGVGHEDGGHSGRYPWGSGKEPYQHASDFLTRVYDLKKQGFSQTEIARTMGFVEYDKEGNVKLKPDGTPYTQTTHLRTQMSLAKDENRMAQVARAKKLRADGYSLKAIANEMGFANDSSVRTLLNENAEKNSNAAKVTAEFLKEKVDNSRYGMIDVGKGIEKEVGLNSREKMEQSLYILEREGYHVYLGSTQQTTNDKQKTNLKILARPEVEYKEIYQPDKIDFVTEYTRDEGKTFTKLVYPASMDSSRLQIVYKEDGGIDKDGVMEIRRGVKDLSLGEDHYAQVRILVDGDRYLKGMAVYGDDEDFPDGIDIRFNTNKSKGTPMRDVLKEAKKDPDNPFGSLIKAGGQSYYDDPNGEYTDPITGNKQSLSLINKKSSESDWSDWSNNLPAQFLSKQSMKLINKQLNLAKIDKLDEYNDICALTNPTVKKFRLQKFAEDCDAAAVQLKAAALPGQQYHVILPVNTIPETEVYAPGYKEGEKLALIRYPHGGTFEIPIVTVNNSDPIAKKIIGNASDAIAINKSVADRLSGADFDGDTVMVLPTNNKTKITSTPELEGLKHYKYADGHVDAFDPKEAYPYKEGMTIMSKGGTQTQMGIISNLITDMTLKGANEDELARAVRHSMVVIDAHKHKLNYKQSELDNDIKGLHERYQAHIGEDGKVHYGSSTLISQSKSKQVVKKRKGQPKIDEKTGELIFKEVEEYYPKKHENKKTGEITYGPEMVLRTQDSTKMAETKDAYTLSSGTLQEEAYAEYANYMKSLANTARKEYLKTGKIEYSASARQTYAKEVEHLEAQLRIAESNAPKERRATLLANSEVNAKKLANPKMTKAEIKKIRQQAITKARLEVGASRHPIDISDKEWEAIQAGAISESKLKKILNNADTEKVFKLSSPQKNTKTLSDSKIARIKSMDSSGYTTAEIAEALGISSSSVSNVLRS